jgi:S-adenosylmethionine:tRNA ribosyltransferase-isomerase
VKLEVASAGNGITHTMFARVDEFLDTGDVLVVNDSATVPAALDGLLGTRAVRLHISTPVPGTRKRLVELREPNGASSYQCIAGRKGSSIALPADGLAILEEPVNSNTGYTRLWQASLHLPEPLFTYLHHWGQPIRYPYVSRPWPLRHYQTIFAVKPGSSEMPSAGRPFTHMLMRRLAARGVKISAVTLHTGVASLEHPEPPYPEPYLVSHETAHTINTQRQRGSRIIAVGTTVVRCLQTVCAEDGSVEPGQGFTDVVIKPDSTVKAIDGMITGWHEPNASHLMMLEAVAGRELVERSYKEALSHNYLWHEFGDSHLILT